MLLLLHTLLNPAQEPEHPLAPPQEQGGGGGLALRNKGPATAVQSAPWRWVPFTPVAATRPRKKRQADVLLLGG